MACGRAFATPEVLHYGDVQGINFLLPHLVYNMLTCPPEIIVDDFATPASKRRRLNSREPEAVAIESACIPHKFESSTPKPLSTCATIEDLCENDLVCYGMVRIFLLDCKAGTDNDQVSDLEVSIPPRDHVGSDPSNEHRIRFEPPRTLYSSQSDAPCGQLNQYGSELLTRLLADDELLLQFSLSTTPVAPAPSIGIKLSRNASQFLGIIIYGPKRRFGDVGEFMTHAGCFLDDPINCDRNVPYLNPQCLFSVHERLPMTFEILQPQQPHIDNFERVSSDVLSRFETTEEFELSASPPALRTKLKTYVSCHLNEHSCPAADIGLIGIKDKHSLFSEDGNVVCTRLKMGTVCGCESRVLASQCMYTANRHAGSRAKTSDAPGSLTR